MYNDEKMLPPEVLAEELERAALQKYLVFNWAANVEALTRAVTVGVVIITVIIFRRGFLVSQMMVVTAASLYAGLEFLLYYERRRRLRYLVRLTDHEQ